MNKKIFTIFIIGLVVVLGVSWFFIKDKEQEEEYEGPVEKVSIATPPGFFSSIVWIAKEKGYFEKHGLEVDIVEQDVGEEGFSKVLEGDIDIAFIAHTPIAKQSLGRDDFAIFASLATSSDDMKIIARKGDGILKAEDLKGKKIGIPDASTARFFLSYFLLNNNLSHSDIEKVYYLPSELPGALKAGEVDAIAIREPFIGISKQFIDEEIVKLSDYHTHEEIFILASLKKFIENNPQAIEKVISAFDDTITFIRENEEEAKDITAKSLDLDIDIVNTLWDNFEFEVSLSQALILALEHDAILMLEHENNHDKTRIKNTPNFLDYIYFDALEAVKPESVFVIH